MGRCDDRSCILVCPGCVLTALFPTPTDSPLCVALQVAGLLLYDSGTAVISHTTLRDHSVSNIRMQDDSEATLTSNQIVGSLAGLKMHGSAKAVLRENSFSVLQRVPALRVCGSRGVISCRVLQRNISSSFSTPLLRSTRRQLLRFPTCRRP